MNPNGTVSELLRLKGSAVWSISPTATVFEAISMMADKNVGALLVTEKDKLVGIISERDYTRKVALKGKSSKQTAVKEILSGQVIHVSPSHTVEECMRLMTDHHIRHLPVLDGEKICRSGLHRRPGQLDHLRPDHDHSPVADLHHRLPRLTTFGRIQASDRGCILTSCRPPASVRSS